METKIIDIIDSDKIINIEDDYCEDCIFKMSPSIDLIKDRANIILSGQTKSGKTTLLQNILQKKLLKFIKPSNIYIFSKTAKIDLAYRPLIMFLIKNTTNKLKIYDEIEMEIIKNIVEN